MNKTAIQPKGLNIAKELNTSKPSTILHGILRICSLILCLSMFFPGLNPARISNLINRNISLFTTGLSFSDLTTKFTAMFRQGAVDKSTFVLLSAASVVIIVGTVLCGIGGCMSLGNNRMKLRGIWFPIVGSLIASGGLVGIYRSYLQLQASRGAKRAQVVFPSVFYLYIGLLGLILLVSLIILLTERRGRQDGDARNIHSFLCCCPS